MDDVELILQKSSNEEQWTYKINYSISGISYYLLIQLDVKK